MSSRSARDREHWFVTRPRTNYGFQMLSYTVPRTLNKFSLSDSELCVFSKNSFVRSASLISFHEFDLFNNLAAPAKYCVVSYVSARSVANAFFTLIYLLLYNDPLVCSFLLDTEIACPLYCLVLWKSEGLQVFFFFLIKKDRFQSAIRPVQMDYLTMSMLLALQLAGSTYP